MKSFNNVAFLATASAHTLVSGVQNVTLPAGGNSDIDPKLGNVVVALVETEGTAIVPNLTYTPYSPGGELGTFGTPYIIHNRATSLGDVSVADVTVKPGWTAEIAHIGSHVPGNYFDCVSVTSPTGSVTRYAIKDFTADPTPEGGSSDDGLWNVNGAGAWIQLWTAAALASALLNTAGALYPAMKIYENVGGNFEEVIAGLQSSPAGGVTANIDVPGATGFAGRAVVYVG